MQCVKPLVSPRPLALLPGTSGRRNPRRSLSSFRQRAARDRFGDRALTGSALGGCDFRDRLLDDHALWCGASLPSSSAVSSEASDESPR